MPTYVFRKSSYSTPDHECVEVATNVPDTVAIRDSKNPDGPTLRLPATAWTAFRGELVAGRFAP